MKYQQRNELNARTLMARTIRVRSARGRFSATLLAVVAITLALFVRPDGARGATPITSTRRTPSALTYALRTSSQCDRYRGPRIYAVIFFNESKGSEVLSYKIDSDGAARPLCKVTDINEGLLGALH
jgi:hypothetical protein